MDRRAPVKKPSGGRPFRTFSTESGRLFAEQSDAQLAAPSDTLQRDNKPATLRLVKQNVASGGTLTPSPQFDEISLSPGDFGSRKNQTSDIHSPEPIYGRPGSPKPSSLLPIPPSPSKLRWDSVRRHVLHDSTSSDSPTITPPRLSSPKPSLLAPARPSTPKTSRFPRLGGMRQVVDNVREAVVDDLRRFTEDLERACAETRNSDVVRAPKVEREASQGTVGSYLSLPLAVAGGSTTTQIAKQSSQQSFSASRPSVNALLRTLERYEVSPLNRPRMLPLEGQVLSALLTPFLSPGVVDSEKQLALRAFTLITQTWRTDTNEVNIIFSSPS